eukprot:1514060-Rhodomonas_salina.1
MEDTALNLKNINRVNARDCEKKAAGRLRRMLEEAKSDLERDATEEALLEVQGLAKRLCMYRELVQEGVDEALETAAGRRARAVMEQAGVGSEQPVSLLLVAGANVDAVSDDAMTALMAGAQRGHTGVVRVLCVEGKAYPAAEDGKEGGAALHLAAENGHVETVSALLRERGATAHLNSCNSPYAGGTALTRAAYFGFLATVQLLVREGGVDSNAATNNAATALMAAASRGHGEVVEWLGKEGGADTNAANKIRRTALMKAAQKGHEEVVKWLGKEGAADTNAAKNDGATALMLAASNGHQDVGRFSWRRGGQAVLPQIRWEAQP